MSYGSLRACPVGGHRWHPQNGGGYYCPKCGLITYSSSDLSPAKPEPFKSSTRSPLRVVGAPKGASRLAKIAALIERDGRACFYCEHELLDPKVEVSPHHQWWPTLDHLLPRALGGTNDLDNLVLACSYCNGRKGDHVRLLAEVIGRLRVRNAQLEGQVASRDVFIDHLQWEMFDAGLGEMPGRTEVSRSKRKPFKRPRPTIRDTALAYEVGERAFANLKTENLGHDGGRRAAIAKRWRATERPRKNVLHVSPGRNPRGVL